MAKKKKYADENGYIQYGGYDIDTNRNYEQAKREYADVGNYNRAGLMEDIRNSKIDAGYGNEYDKTYKYNYKPKYLDKSDDLRGQLEDYSDFSWDANSDDAYRGLASVYHYNAQKASDNALANAAAANGGRLGANAITAASLAYQDKMSGLESEIPQLRQAAYSMYRDNKNDLRNLMYDVEAAEDRNYSRWSDDYNRRYQNTWDLINHNLKEREFEESRLNNEANRGSLTFNDALAASKALGYGTNKFGEITGTAPGTAMADFFNTTEDRRLALAKLLGTVPGWINGSYGFGDQDSVTLERLIADMDYDVSLRKIAEDYANGKYTYGSGITGGTGGTGGSGGGSYTAPDYTSTVDNTTALPESKSVNLDNIYKAATQSRTTDGAIYYINEAVKNGQITEKEAEILYQKLGV